MNGVLIVDKPQGFTSFDVVAKLRRLTGEKKIGHTGTLDPMATGVLPMLLGRGAKACDLLEDTEKTYRASFRLGEKRDTGDITGTIMQSDQVSVSQAGLLEVLPAFRGTILQLPPMYSAVSVGGKRLYELARQGIEVEREKRPVTIHRLELLSYDPQTKEGTLEVECSKGTYVRTLIEDLGAAVGSCGVMTALIRTKACGFSLEQAHTIPSLESLSQSGGLEALLRPVDTLFSSCPPVMVTEAQAARFQNGGGLGFDRLKLPRMALVPDLRLRVYGPGEVFLGLGRADLEARECKLLKLFTLLH